MKKGGLIAAILVLSGVSTLAQDDKPLGDLAREARASKSAQPKSAKVTTNDDVPSSEAAVGGALSARKQDARDELRRRKDMTAEQNCLLLALDMGSEYEALTARLFELGKAFVLPTVAEFRTVYVGTLRTGPRLARQAICTPDSRNCGRQI